MQQRAILMDKGLPGRFSLFRIGFLTCFLLFISACSSTHLLSPTPNLYSEVGAYPSLDVAKNQQTTTPTFFYVTDRLTEKNQDGEIFYGEKRSSGMVFGSVQIQYGQDTTWHELIVASETQKRKKKIKLEILEPKELVKFPSTPLPFEVKNGKAVTLEPGASNYLQAESILQELLSKSLSLANRKEVILFVHGFNNDFRDAALSLADIWHFTGRVGVPIFYTWPAADGGLFGYFKDRESGEFTIYHLKELIRMLARSKELEKIHIVTHSRGTDIMTTALRELIIEARGARVSPLEKNKIANLLLAAPDLDYDVVKQRLIAESFGIAFGRVTVYINKDDGALGISQFLMSGLRFGRLENENLGIAESKILANVKTVNFIHVEGVSGFFGHDYFRTHPGVLSDIAVTIRELAEPGSEHRPLTHEAGAFWKLDENYLRRQ